MSDQKETLHGCVLIPWGDQWKATCLCGWIGPAGDLWAVRDVWTELHWNGALGEGSDGIR